MAAILAGTGRRGAGRAKGSRGHWARNIISWILSLALRHPPAYVTCTAITPRKETPDGWDQETTDERIYQHRPR